MTITWIPINDYPGDQQADLPGGFWAEIGGDEKSWSWTILVNDDTGSTREVGGGTVATEALAKSEVEMWSPRHANITRDRDADGTPVPQDSDGIDGEPTVWNIGLYEGDFGEITYTESMGAATHRGAIAVADAWINYKSFDELSAATWVE